MGKLLFIAGGNGSGKSRYAEALVSHTTGPRYYIATMEPHTPENFQRIRRHIAQRSGLGFETREVPVGVEQVQLPAGSVVLLEDGANLLSNTLFMAGGSLEDVWRGICTLQSRCRLLVVVSISGLEETGYQGETAAYIRDLNILNRRLFDRAEGAVSMKDHRPVWEKGAEHDVL